MTGFKNAYQALGLPDFADADAVKSAFRQLARQHHPDLHGGDVAKEEAFKAINAAYEILNDPIKRALHDRQLKTVSPASATKAASSPQAGKPEGVKPASKTSSAKQATPPHSKAKPSTAQKQSSPKEQATANSFGDLLDDWLKKGFSAGKEEEPAAEKKSVSSPTPASPHPPPADKHAPDGLLGKVWSGVTGEATGREKPHRGEDVLVKTLLSPAEATEGTVKTVHVQHHEVCRRCSATGKVNGAPCTACHGEKSHTRIRKMEVRIPAGVKSGSRVRVAREGGRGSHGGEAGDLYLQIEVSDESAFRIDGIDVHGELTISVTDAVLGAEVEVPTLNGPVMMTIPPATQPGRVFRLKERGVKNGAVSGDHFVTVTITIPDHLSTKEQDLYKELAKLRPGKYTGKSGP